MAKLSKREIKKLWELGRLKQTLQTLFDLCAYSHPSDPKYWEHGENVKKIFEFLEEIGHLDFYEEAYEQWRKQFVHIGDGYLIKSESFHFKEGD